MNGSPEPRGEAGAERAVPRQLIERHVAARSALMERYLELLDRQQDAIRARSLEQLALTIDREQELLASVEARQRTIRALDPAAADEATFVRLQAEARSRQRHNRELLAAVMDETRTRMDGVHLPRRARSVYRLRDAGGMIDLTT